MLCRSANAAWSKRLYHCRLQGLHAERDSRLAAVQAHLSHLAEHGLGLRRVSHLSGVDVRHLRRIRHGHVRRLTAATVAKILATKPIRARQQLVPAITGWRIVRWLKSEGYTQRAVASLIGHKRTITLRKHYRADTVARLLCVKRRLEAGSERPPFGEHGAEEGC